jgi:hypothetical protein
MSHPLNLQPRGTSGPKLARTDWHASYSQPCGSDLCNNNNSSGRTVDQPGVEVAEADASVGSCTTGYLPSWTPQTHSLQAGGRQTMWKRRGSSRSWEHQGAAHRTTDRRSKPDSDTVHIM